MRIKKKNRNGERIEENSEKIGVVGRIASLVFEKKFISKFFMMNCQKYNVLSVIYVKLASDSNI